ncbi:MAG: sigma-70 family RNA polymerase sigma factor [Firmicutes bacterium]|nr:sigma-70 family RNA polymerase sigma factor [Bacillota bacterium]
MDYKEYLDGELCSMISENNEEAKEILYNKYKYIIDIVIKKYLLSSYKVGIEYSDLQQEALVGFSDALYSYDEKKEASIATFITVCVERRLQKVILKASSLKNKMFLEALSLDYQQADGSSLKEIISDNSKNDPLINMSIKEKHEELIKKIEKELSNTEREVFTLLVSGLTYKEISTELNKDPKQIDNSIQRIKNKAKKLIIE